MVMVRRSVILATLFSWASLDVAVNLYSVHIFLLVTENSPS